jgi:mono/diheme cytochrome c family protein
VLCSQQEWNIPGDDPMAWRFMVLATAACVMFSAAPDAARAQSDQQELKLVTPPLSLYRNQIRPLADALPVPAGSSREQILHGDRVFHGEAANGQCSVCHANDGKGTPNGNDLTAGMFVWSDGSVKELKRTILHNMEVAPGRDGDLEPADVDAVSAYVWAISHQ